jgi:hypothetical protein
MHFHKLCNKFPTVQGFTVEKSLLYQDNMSAILLETNGRASSSKRTRHMNIRFFYIKDNVDAGVVQIEHCGTNDMVADFFTKTLQGHQFRVLRDIIMHIDQSSKYHSGHRSVLVTEESDKYDTEEIVGDETSDLDTLDEGSNVEVNDGTKVNVKTKLYEGKLYEAHVKTSDSEG